MARGERPLDTIVEAHVVFLGILIALGAVWIMGIVKLFQKGRTTLGYMAIAGILIPIIAPVGFAGWFVKPVDEWDRPLSDPPAPGSQDSIL